MARLAAISDSLTQGFQSLAITQTDLSFPALVAECMGLGLNDFRAPDFKGSGGLPLNIEWLARKLERIFGNDVRAFEWIGATFKIVDLIDEVEDYWERGKGSRPGVPTKFHNLAIWGWEVGDACDLSAGICRKAIDKTKDGWFSPPSEPRLRTGYRVLNPSHDKACDHNTQISIARQISEENGGIDHLILGLGANNCLGTVVDLEIRMTRDSKPGPNSGFTLWTAAAFKAEYDELVAKVQGLGAKHVYVTTVPHVTIPPITRGVMKNCGRLPASRKYFDYYTRFWIHDKNFDPSCDPHLTGAQAQQIDDYVDEYNAIIKKAAADNGWHIVDICKLLDDLAVRRNHGTASMGLPSPIADLSVRFFEVNPDGSLKEGGLIGLDGVHPTTCGYGLMAQEFIDQIKKFEPNCKDIDFAELRRWDSLVSNPPRTLDDIFGMLQVLEKRFHMSRWLSQKPDR